MSWEGKVVLPFPTVLLPVLLHLLLLPLPTVLPAQPGLQVGVEGQVLVLGEIFTTI